MENKDMYFDFFNRLSNVIEELQQIQREMEDMYIKAKEIDNE